ncbi:MAG: hypothetical protein DRN90_00245 [Thermoproteota archaeon]|nr:MAG: hypothetical protein DRN90_00245 [Candidatus Korarchaeota archaeon]
MPLDKVLKFLKHMFITDGFKIGKHNWLYRISEGEYEWAAALTAHPKDEPLYNPYTPFTIYAYKVRDPETNWEGYILAIYPTGCAESACAEYIQTEATDKDLADWMETVAEIVPLYYSDPEEFYERLADNDMYRLSPEELELYEFLHPSPTLARKLVDSIAKRRKFVKVKHVSLAIARW